MTSVSTPPQRGRILRQQIPTPPPHYDQVYLSQLASAVNDYMTQASAPGDVVAARFICTAPYVIPGDLPDTSTLPTGTFYLMQLPGAPTGTYVLTLVQPVNL